ncbi:predicted protein [Nematostella vectensis]|uniref:Developmental pluripotency-associated protein 2/4 C-terminal domain-containing protein n=1 Tax=Nematostella vectensis TaxID=45351 RepID=A7T0M3_NEMVE|nr:predicted protein [Nematostella vectensis]|eukprot:XP_001622592.1 predicted protein [Nematostella vectensis]
MSSAQSENPEANKLDSKEVDLCVKDSDQMDVSTGNSRSCESVESANVCGDAVDDTSRTPGNQREVIVADDVCFETSTSSGCDLSSTEPTTGVKDAANRTFTIPRTVENTVNETGKVENDCVQSSSEVLQSQDVTSSLQWCVAHGAIRSFNKLTWKLIRLKGGRPVVPNRFGKYIPFTLTPSQLIVPTGFQDNFICEECVRSNETISNVECEQEVKENVTPLTGISRESIRASIKRKREEEMGGTGSEEVNAENKRRRKSVPRSAGTSPLTPASPDIRKARGETLALPRNLSKPWQPKKRSPGVSTTVQEDQNFAKKVEDIIRNVVPGSDEELLLIMGKKSHVSHSPPRA